MPDIPNWSGALSVGNPLIDEQHKKLITLCVRAGECASITTPDARQEFHAILNDLAALTDIHFNDEERLLIKNRSPNLVAHQAEHAIYRELVVNLLIEGTSGFIDQAQLYQVASDYLVKHMAEMDVADKAFMQA